MRQKKKVKRAPAKKIRADQRANSIFAHTSLSSLDTHNSGISDDRESPLPPAKAKKRTLAQSELEGIADHESWLMPAQPNPNDRSAAVQAASSPVVVTSATTGLTGGVAADLLPPMYQPIELQALHLPAMVSSNSTSSGGVVASLAASHSWPDTSPKQLPVRYANIPF